MNDISFTHHRERLNGRRQHFVTAGEGPAVLFLHGFPDLWRCWSAQLKAVAAAGYTAIAPDLRGYGETEGSPDPEQYTAIDVMADQLAILDHLKIDKVTVVAHDWGTNTGWAAVQLRPDRFIGIVAISVPWMPHGDRSLPQILKEEAPPNYYFPYFLNPGPADAEFDANPREFLRRIMYTNSAERPGGPPKMQTVNGSLVEGLDAPSGPMTFLPDSELDIYTDAFTKSGATSALNSYRGLHRSWELMKGWADYAPDVPARTIVGDRDLTVEMPGMREIFDAQPEWLPQGMPTIWLEGTGHFAQMEAPGIVSRHILDFLEETRS